MADSNSSHVEVYDEPLHTTVLDNDYVRVIHVQIPEGGKTLYHRHSENSFFTFFSDTKVENTPKDKEMFEAHLTPGHFYWGNHRTEPLIHQVCTTQGALDCMDIEIKYSRPKPEAARPTLAHPDHEVVFETDCLRVYRVRLAPGVGLEGGTVLYNFPRLVVNSKDGVVSRPDHSRGNIVGGEAGALGAGAPWPAGAFEWYDSEGQYQIANAGDTILEFLILEPL